MQTLLVFTKDREITTGVDIDTKWLIRSVIWDDGELWEAQYLDDIEEVRGWWSSLNSHTAEKLDGLYEPTHWLCETRGKERE